jgi:lysophospholipase L1-like esterase
MITEMPLFIIIVALVVFIAGEGFYLIKYTQKGVAAGKKAVRCEKINPNAKHRMLVIGDCGTVSVGVSDPRHSIVGRISTDFRDVSIFNRSKNSMSFAYLEKRMRELSSDHFDVIVMHIGSIDAILFTPQFILRKRLQSIKTSASAMRPKAIIFVSMCNLGSSTLFRFPLRYLYDIRTKRLTDFFAAECARLQLTHVPLYEPRDRDALTHPTNLFTDDLLHPNDIGHGVWYQKIKPALTKSLS